MLRCRRCRRVVVDSACLMVVEAGDESSTAACSIWHVNVDVLPEWILTSVQQAQWSVGKLHCQNCSARLGGFNFLHRSECPCGRDAAVHLSKSRVDREHRQAVLIVQPGRTRPERRRRGGAAAPAHEEHGERLQLNCAAVASHLHVHAAAAPPPPHGEHSHSFSFSPLYCISHRRRRSMGDRAAVRTSCFCPAALTDESAAETPPRPRADSPLTRFEAAGGESSARGGGGWYVSIPTPPEAAEEERVEDAAAQEEEPDSVLLLRGRTVSDSVAEQEEELLLRAPATSVTFLNSPTAGRLSKRERNRLKSLRRKQRRRERWLHAQLGHLQVGSVRGVVSDSEEEEDREGLTCAVCLDVYFSPHSCRPCGHIFCEPCLRTLAKNRPSSTPCPLCRTLISHTDFHKELNQTSKTAFPKVYYARKKTFQNAPCVKWPLPSCKPFRNFWVCVLVLRLPAGGGDGSAALAVCPRGLDAGRSGSGRHARLALLHRPLRRLHPLGALGAGAAGGGLPGVLLLLRLRTAAGGAGSSLRPSFFSSPPSLLFWPLKASQKCWTIDHLTTQDRRIKKSNLL